MSLPVPNLDDRTFDQLAAEARSLIPRYFPAWTDHNSSDPGITLLELFAFLQEAAIYQLNRIPERSLARFAELAGVSRQSDPLTGQPEPIEQTLRRALEVLEQKYRAILTTDFEFLVTKGVYTIQSPFQQDHSAPPSAVVPAVMMETLPDTAVLRDRVPDHTPLKLVSGANLTVNDLVLIDDGARTEVVRISSISQATQGVDAITDPLLSFGHERGVKLEKVLSQTATSLAAPVNRGDRFVVLEPLAQLPRAGVLRVDTGTKMEYVRARGIARAKALVEVMVQPNIFPAEQIIKVIIVPDDPTSSMPLPTDELRQAVFEFLHPRRLITTRVRVLPPVYTGIRMTVRIARDLSRRSGQDPVPKVGQAIRKFLDPITGGVDGTGWEFGRPVFRSELYQIIEGIPGVDHVAQLILNGDEAVGEVPLSSTTSLVRLDELIVATAD